MKPVARMLCLGLLALLFAGTQAHAREVTVLFGYSLPPYVIRDTNHPEGSGFELEVFKAALAARGHSLKPVFVEIGNITNLLRYRQADGAQRGNPGLREEDGFFYANEPTATYQDVAISLTKNGLTILSVPDLKDKSIAAFQGASAFLGPDYGIAVKDNRHYYETSDEKSKIAMLFGGKVQVYVGDINIFKYYRGLSASVDTSQEVTVHKIFLTPTLKTNNAVFLDRRIRDDFNAGLKQIKASGLYRQIVRRYIAE